MKSMNTNVAIKLKGQNGTMEIVITIYDNEPKKEKVMGAN